MLARQPIFRFQVVIRVSTTINPSILACIFICIGNHSYGKTVGSIVLNKIHSHLVAERIGQISNMGNELSDRKNKSKQNEPSRNGPDGEAVLHEGDPKDQTGICQTL